MTHMKHEAYLEAGKIVNTHGVRGEVKIEPWADSPDFLRHFRTLYIDGRAVNVLSARVHGAFVIAALEGVADVNAAMALKNKIVRIARADVTLPEGSFFLSDIVGARVVTDTGEELGTLTEVMERPAHNIYVVQGEREHLIPAVPAFILNTDVENGVVTVHMIEGL